MRAAVALLALLGACTASNPHCGDGFTDPGLGEQCDDGNTMSGDGCSATCQIETPPSLGHIQATWQLADIAAGGQLTPTPCPAGFDTVAVHSAVATADGVITDPCTVADASCFIDLFNCSDGAGTTADLPPQTYVAWIEVTDATGTSVYATSTAAFVDLTNSDQMFDAVVLNNGGYFLLTWSLVGEQSGAPLTCAQTAASSAAGGSIETTATIAGGTTAFSDKFFCEAPFGYSAGLPAGTYTVAVDALNSADQALSSQSVVLQNRSIGSQNAITNLGRIVIPIAGM